MYRVVQIILWVFVPAQCRAPFFITIVHWCAYCLHILGLSSPASSCYQSGTGWIYMIVLDLAFHNRGTVMLLGACHVLRSPGRTHMYILPKRATVLNPIKEFCYFLPGRCKTLSSTVSQRQQAFNQTIYNKHQGGWDDRAGYQLKKPLWLPQLKTAFFPSHLML